MGNEAYLTMTGTYYLSAYFKKGLQQTEKCQSLFEQFNALVLASKYRVEIYKAIYQSLTLGNQQFFH